MPGRSWTADVAYRLDGQDRITFVNAAWDAFARRNGAPDLIGQRVCGTELWGYVADKETRHLYGLLFAQVRRTGQPITLPFNCDSPTCRRFMELRLAALPAGGLALTGRLLREEAREPAPLLDSCTARSQSLLCICSWCKRIVAGSDEWIEVEEAIRRWSLFSAAVLPQLTHGICPACRSLLDGRLPRKASP